MTGPLPPTALPHPTSLDDDHQSLDDDDAGFDDQQIPPLSYDEGGGFIADDGDGDALVHVACDDGAVGVAEVGDDDDDVADVADHQ